MRPNSIFASKRFNTRSRCRGREEKSCDFIFKDRENLLDKMSRMNTKKMQSSASAMKYYYGCNHYGERDKLINAGISIDECPRWSEIKAWEHVVRYRKTVSMRAEFILMLCEDLKKLKVPGVTDEELITLIKDIR